MTARAAKNRSSAAGFAAGEDDIGALSPGTPGRPEPDACAAADHCDGLSGPFRFAPAGNPQVAAQVMVPPVDGPAAGHRAADGAGEH